jgi:hypothetical protein
MVAKKLITLGSFVKEFSFLGCEYVTSKQVIKFINCCNQYFFTHNQCDLGIKNTASYKKNIKELIILLSVEHSGSNYP